MYKLLITGCTDSMRWYSDKIGEYVPYRGRVFNPEEYRSVDSGGFNNFVQLEDAKLEYHADYDEVDDDNIYPS